MPNLYDWQEKVISEASERPRRALFAAPRLGKTRATAIMIPDRIDRLLVAAPLSVCGGWTSELELQGWEIIPAYLWPVKKTMQELFATGANKTKCGLKRDVTNRTACNQDAKNPEQFASAKMGEPIGFSDVLSMTRGTMRKTAMFECEEKMGATSWNTDSSLNKNLGVSSESTKRPTTSTEFETIIDQKTLNCGLEQFDMDKEPTMSSVLTVGRRTALVINYDKIPNLLPALKLWKPKGQIYDESHLLKNPQSSRSKAVRRLAGVASCSFLRILTGTPSPNHYGDLWAQMTLVNAERWGRAFGPFAQRFLLRDAIYPSKIIGHHNVAELQGWLNADADIIRREDVFGPDTYQFIDRWVDMPRHAQDVYSTLVKEWLYLHERGEVLADHALKRLIRLQQLTSGYLRTEDGENIPIHTAKLDAVLSDLEEIIASGEKSVVFHRFTWEGSEYHRAISERFPGIRVYDINGATPAEGRTRAEGGLRDDRGPVVLIAQTRTAALGVSFAEATHALFVSESFSFTDEDQARDRIYKPGFNRCVAHYRVRNSVDTFIAAAISAKADIHSSVSHADIREMAYGTIKRK